MISLSKPIFTIMGVYYHFYNVTREQHNYEPIPGFGKSNFVAKLNWIPETDIIKIFQSIIAINNWSDTDILRSSPDYPDYPSIMYFNNSIIYVNTIDNDHPDSEHNDDYDELYFSDEETPQVHNPSPTNMGSISDKSNITTKYPQEINQTPSENFPPYETSDVIGTFPIIVNEHPESEDIYDLYVEDYDY